HGGQPRYRTTRDRELRLRRFGFDSSRQGSRHGRQPSEATLGQVRRWRVSMPAVSGVGLREPALAPDRGRITVSHDTMFHQRPRQVKGVVRCTDMKPVDVSRFEVFAAEFVRAYCETVKSRDFPMSPNEPVEETVDELIAAVSH